MSIIKPISDLRNKSNEISDLARDMNEPIFITKNGEGDMVVLGMKHYRELTLKLKLFEKLSEAQAEESNGLPTKSLSEVMKKVRSKIDEKKN